MLALLWSALPPGWTNRGLDGPEDERVWVRVGLEQVQAGALLTERATRLFDETGCVPDGSSYHGLIDDGARSRAEPWPRGPGRLGLQGDVCDQTVLDLVPSP